MTRLPKDATGANPLVDWLNALKQCVWDRTPLDSKDLLLERTQNGFRYILRSKPKGGTTASLEIKDYIVVQICADHLTCYEYTDNFDGTATLGASLVNVAKPRSLRASTWINQQRTTVGTDIVTTLGPKTVDARTYTMMRHADGSTVYADWRQEPFHRRLVTNVGGTLPIDEIASDANPSSVNHYEQIVPAYIPAALSINAGNTVTTATLVGSVIKAVKSDGEINFPAVNESTSQYYNAPVSCDWLDMNTDGRLWLPRHKSIIICETSGGETVQRRVVIRCSESYPL